MSQCIMVDANSDKDAHLSSVVISLTEKTGLCFSLFSSDTQLVIKIWEMRG